MSSYCACSSSYSAKATETTDDSEPSTQEDSSLDWLSSEFQLGSCCDDVVEKIVALRYRRRVFGKERQSKGVKEQQESLKEILLTKLEREFEKRFHKKQDRDFFFPDRSLTAFTDFLQSAVTTTAFPKDRIKAGRFEQETIIADFVNETVKSFMTIRRTNRLRKQFENEVLTYFEQTTSIATSIHQGKVIRAPTPTEVNAHVVGEALGDLPDVNLTLDPKIAAPIFPAAAALPSVNVNVTKSAAALAKLFEWYSKYKDEKAWQQIAEMYVNQWEVNQRRDLEKSVAEKLALAFQWHIEHAKGGKRFIEQLAECCAERLIQNLISQLKASRKPWNLWKKKYKSDEEMFWKCIMEGEDVKNAGPSNPPEFTWPDKSGVWQPPDKPDRLEDIFKHSLYIKDGEVYTRRNSRSNRKNGFIYCNEYNKDNCKNIQTEKHLGGKSAKELIASPSFYA